MSQKTEVLENELKRIIENNELAEQSEIQDKLREKGIDLPQSTLSRWLKKLNIIKVHDRYQIVNQEPKARIPVLSIKVALPNLVVLRTLPGHASSLAYQIDQNMDKAETLTMDSPVDPYKGVIGTIAGDDTILVIMQDKESLLSFKKWLEQNK